MRGLFGVLQLANIAAMDCLPSFVFYLRECAVLDKSSQHFGMVCCIALVIQ